MVNVDLSMFLWDCMAAGPDGTETSVNPRQYSTGLPTGQNGGIFSVVGLFPDNSNCVKLP